MNTNTNDKYGNAGCNWLHGSKAGGGGKYGAWHDPAEVGANMLDEPTDNAGYAAHADDALYNRTQARSPNDSSGNKGIYPGFSWAWLRNRRVFYNKGGFCPGDIGDIFVSPDEVGTLFMGVPGYTVRHPVVSYTGCWRGSRNLNDVPINTADATQWSKRGYTPVHWEPHESPRADLVTAHGQIGRTSNENYADTAEERAEFPFILTTYRHTEHYQGGVMTRNVPWLNELVPEAVVEINSADAAANGIAPSDQVEIMTLRTVKKDALAAASGIAATTITVNTIGEFSIGDDILIGADGTQEKRTITGIIGSTISFSTGLLGTHAAGEQVINVSQDWCGPWRAVVGSGVGSTQKVNPGVVAIPWHWGSAGLATGPTANDLCIDAQDGNTKMPETKVALCKIKKV
jgi:hypothetical protein